MDNNSSNWQGIGLAFILLGVIAWVFIAIFGQIAHAPWQFLSVLMAFIGATITFASTYLSQIRNEQRENKVRIYEEITSFLSQLFYSLMTESPQSRGDIDKFAIDITPSLLMWASDGVVKSFLDFLESDEPLVMFEIMMLEIRKDLGHNNNLPDRPILRMFNYHLRNLEQ